MQPLVMGIDIGTGSTKGVLCTADGTIMGTARRDHSMKMPKPGWAEMDAEADWWEDAAAVCRELIEGAPGSDIKGVCVSGLGPAVVVCDDNLSPRRPAILYGIDSRATQEIEQLNALFGSEEILQRCGKHLSSQSLGPKLVWLRDKADVAWAPNDRWFSSHNYVVAKLTGEWVLDHHTASQCDPLYDIRRQDWARDWADEMLPGVGLPRLAWPGEKIGTVHSVASKQTGLPVGTPVMAGTVDAWAEAFSAGVRRPGDLMLMYGSTMFMVQVISAPAVSPGLWTTSGIEQGSHTLAAGMSTSGSLTEWLSKLFGGVSFEDLVKEAAAVPPGSDGLVMLPYFAGERSPIFDPDARGLVAGLTLRHTRGHLFRAAYEGIAFGIRQILEVLESAAGTPVRVCAVGGGTQGGLWTQIVSDVCKIEQAIPVTTIGASYGDALLASIGVGLNTPETDWAGTAQIVMPDPSTAAVYDTAYRTYCSLYPATRKDMHVLAEIQKKQGS